MPDIFLVGFKSTVTDEAEKAKVVRFVRTEFHSKNYIPLLDNGEWNGVYVLVEDDRRSANIQTHFNRSLFNGKYSTYAISVGIDYSGLPKGMETLFSSLPPSGTSTVRTASHENGSSLANFVGAEEVCKAFLRKCANTLRNRSNNEILGTRIKDPNLNLLLVGKRGVGKKTLSMALPQHMIDLGIVGRRAPVVCVTMTSLMNDGCRSLNEKLGKATGGIFVIDKLDAPMDFEGDGPAMYQTLAGYMSQCRNNPIVIATCLEENYRNLADTEPLLASRFAMHTTLPAYDDVRLSEIFMQKVNDAGLVCADSGIRPAVQELIGHIRKARKSSFSYGHEVEEILPAVLAERNDRFDAAGFSFDGSKGRSGLTAAQTTELSRIKASDVPAFDGALQQFIPRVAPPRRPAKEAPAPSAKVIDLIPKRNP